MNLAKFNYVDLTTTLSAEGISNEDLAEALGVKFDDLYHLMFEEGVGYERAFSICNTIFNMLGRKAAKTPKRPQFIYLIEESSVTEDGRQSTWTAPFAVKTSEEAFEYLQKVSYDNGEWHYNFDSLESHGCAIEAVGTGEFPFSGKNGKPIFKKGTTTITIRKVRVRG